MEVLTIRLEDQCVGITSAYRRMSEAAARFGQVYATHKRTDPGSKLDSLGLLKESVVRLVPKYPNLDKVQVVDEISELGTGDKVFLGARGVPISEREEALARGVEIMGDMTCIFVTRQNEAAVQLAREGYDVLHVGEKTYHGNKRLKELVEREGRHFWVTEDPEELDSLGLTKRVGVVAQTTGNPEKLERVVARLVNLVKDVKVLNTICGDTIPRLKQSRQVAQQAEVVIVIGNGPSARRILEVCSEVNSRVYAVESPEEIRAEWVEGLERVGVIGDNVIPDWMVEDAVVRVKSLGAS